MSAKLINHFFPFSRVSQNLTLSPSHTFTRMRKVATNVVSDKQQPIDENCATGSNNLSQQQTGNGDIPQQQQQHAPPLQVRIIFNLV